MKKVFIDGEAGTTGLRIRARLAARTDIALVTLPEALRNDAAARKAVLKDAYGGSIVRYTETADTDGFLSAAALTGKDAMEIAVFGNEARILLTARYDNLGKGASGAAVECMNLVLGVDPATGLNL